MILTRRTDEANVSNQQRTKHRRSHQSSAVFRSTKPVTSRGRMSMRNRRWGNCCNLSLNPLGWSSMFYDAVDVSRRTVASAVPWLPSHAQFATEYLAANACLGTSLPRLMREHWNGSPYSLAGVSNQIGDCDRAGVGGDGSRGDLADLFSIAGVGALDAYRNSVWFLRPRRVLSMICMSRPVSKVWAGDPMPLWSDRF